MEDQNYRVEQIIKLENDRIFIRVRFNGRTFDIEFGPEDLLDPANKTSSHPSKQQYLDALQHTFGDEAEEMDELHESSDLEADSDMAVSPISSGCDVEEDPVISFAVAPFLTHGTFETFAPEASTPYLSTLQDVLRPPLLSFSLRVVDGDLVPINQSPEEKKFTNPPWAGVWDSQHWLEYPHVKAQEIALAQPSQTSSNTNLVMFNNRICWFKPVLAWVDALPYVREIDMLFKLSRENLSENLRIPQLEAVVVDDRSGEFINGLILSAIYPNRGTIADRVNEPEGESLCSTLRKRWYHDIEDQVHILHNKGFVWGDVSPENMITDEDENVWIIDFGGGYTEGWVEPENMETKKGDLEGLDRLKEYLSDSNGTAVPVGVVT